MIYALAIIAGYLLGSVPFGLVLTRMAGYGDIRTIGSGNIGATNVLRTGNKGLALATLLLDGLKGAIAVLIARFVIGNEDVAMLAGFFAIIGHLYPVWLKFKGGKGVATTFGTLFALQPLLGLAVCGTWLLTAAITRYSSLSALVAVAAAPFFAHFLFGSANLTGLCGVLATIVWLKHRANIERLVKGEEPKIGKKKQ
jgi:glycerol-3-phosphate acyltransferase PlsY